MDNQVGGGHIRDSLVQFLNADVTELINGRYDAATGRQLLSVVAETTQLAGWASYDAGMHGLAQQHLIQALRLAAGAGDRALGAEILAAMSHQAAFLRASGETWIWPRSPAAQQPRRASPRSRRSRQFSKPKAMPSAATSKPAHQR